MQTRPASEFPVQVSDRSAAIIAVRVQVFSLQLAVLARKGDVLITFSGSGNSPNILKALEESKKIGMTSYAVLGFSGGKAKALADVPIHFAVDDMQIAEDAQMVIGHMIMQWLYAQRGDIITTREV